MVGPVFHGLRGLRTLDYWATDYGDFFVGYDEADRVIALKSNLCRRPAYPWERFSDWFAALARPTRPATPGPVPLPPPNK